jgi:polysaccharide export outer membrane protein
LNKRLLLLTALVCRICAAQEDRPPLAQAEPNSTNLPAQPVGPYDLLMVSVYDSPELTRSVRVSGDGKIRLPMLKQPLKISGMLPDAVGEVITEALIEDGVLIDPIVTVGIAEYHSRPISVAGAVRNPITFQAAGPVTLLEAIAKAGGLDRTAGQEILLTRVAMQEGNPATTTLHIPVVSLMNTADPRWNLPLTGGEEIRVPEAGQIFVAGNIAKPGAFSAPDTKDATVIKAVALAGGLLPFYSKQAYIYRPNPDTGVKQEIPIDMAKILSRHTPDVALQPNDILYIPDDRGKRLSIGALEKLLALGTGASTALIYTLR